MNYKRAIEALRESRNSWLDILAKNPDSLAAAQHVVTLNAQIQFLNTCKMLEGDYS